MAKVEEDGQDTRMSQYTTQTEKEEALGLISKQKDWEYDRYQDSNNWELVSGAFGRNHRKVKVGDIRHLPGFGEYHDLGFADVMTYKYAYLKYVMEDKDDAQFQAKKNCA